MAPMLLICKNCITSRKDQYTFSNQISSTIDYVLLQNKKLFIICFVFCGFFLKFWKPPGKSRNGFFNTHQREPKCYRKVSCKFSVKARFLVKHCAKNLTD